MAYDSAMGSVTNERGVACEEEALLRRVDGLTGKRRCSCECGVDIDDDVVGCSSMIEYGDERMSRWM